MNQTRKTLLALLCTLTLVLTIPLGTVSIAEAQSTVVISEIAWMGTTTSYNDEWIELFNNTGSDISLTGWTLSASDGTPSINLTGTIPANGYFLLERTDDTSVPGITSDLIYSGAMGNTGETLVLKDSNTNVVDQVNGWHAGDNSTKATMARIDLTGSSIASNWMTSTTDYTVGYGTPSNTSITVTPPTGSGTWTPGNLEIHHINIGQGDATLVVGPTGKSILFDAGESYWNSSADAQVMGPYIEGVLGHKNLDYVLISHFHLDHIGYVGYGGLWNLVEEQGFTVGQMIHRDYNTYLGTKSGTFENWKTYLEGDGNSKLNPVVAENGTHQVDLGTGVDIDIITVDGSGTIIPGDFSADTTPPSENDYSVGVLLSYGDFDEWIGGDLSGEYAISGFNYGYHDVETKAAKYIGDIDVLRANHHGSDHSNNATFVDQLDPEVSIVSVGDANTYGHPRQTVMDRLLNTSTVYLTERGDTSTNIGSAIVAGHIVIKTADGVSYSVNSDNYTASNPTRIDSDGDGYFIEVDPDDSSSGSVPLPEGGLDPVYQN